MAFASILIGSLCGLLVAGAALLTGAGLLQAAGLYLAGGALVASVLLTRAALAPAGVARDPGWDGARLER